MVSFKIIDREKYVSIFNIDVVVKKTSCGCGYCYFLKGLSDTCSVLLDFCFYSPEEALEMVERIEKVYPYLFEDKKNVCNFSDLNFYPEFSAEKVKESEV